MALQASSATAMFQVRQPEPDPVGLRLVPADPEPDHRLRPLEIAECSMCGITHPLGLLVPDGGGACADVRWYCKDVKSCTERWTQAQSVRPLLREVREARSGCRRHGTALARCAGRIS